MLSESKLRLKWLKWMTQTSLVIPMRKPSEWNNALLPFLYKVALWHQEEEEEEEEEGYNQRGRRESKTAIAIEELLKSTKGIKEAREALDQAEVSSNKSGKSGRKHSSTDSNSAAIVNNSSVNEGTNQMKMLIISS